MAAADYYNAGHTADPNRYNAPISPISSPDVNKPLPPSQQNPFEHPPGGYTDDLSYAPNHYSRESVDTGYYGGRRDDTPPAKPYPDPFSDNIPLSETNPKQYQQQPLSAVEGGGAPYYPARREKRSWMSRPWFVYFITAVQVAVFCGELARNAVLQGTPIAIKPYFNPMIGPSTDVLINMGARFVPCMREVEGFATDDPTQLYPCPNRTTYYLECSLAEWCGFDGKNIPSDLPGGKGGKGSTPNQWWRFILPMFYHAGIIHLGFNMFMQITLGGEMEMVVGMLRFMVVYFCSGIFGFVLGGNLGASGQPSVGASGSLFGIFSLVMLDLFYTWRERAKPMKDLIFLLLDIVISFVLGLLPAIDNFAHIGGFICGIALGLALMRSPNQLRQKIASDPPYTQATAANPYNTSTGDNGLVGFRGFIKQPMAFFKGRKPLWWAWWLVRAGMLTLILVVFIVLMNNFYSTNMKECSWCKYLSCLPVNNWCDMYDSLGAKVVNDTSSGSRMLMSRGMASLDYFF